MEQNQQHPVNDGTKSNFGEDLKTFFKEDFKSILGNLFTNPIDGTMSIFKNLTPKSFQHALILIGSLFVVTFLVFFIGFGEGRGDVPFDIYLKISISPVILVLCITVISFLMKSAFAKGDFKSELLTGAVCAIPVGMFFIISLIYKMIQSDGINVMNPATSGKFFILLMLYVFIMMVMILQQSLRASGTKDSIAFYLSPLAILLSCYLTIRIAFEVFISA